MAGRLSQGSSFGGIVVSVVTRADVLDRLRRSLDHDARLTVTFLNPDYARRAFRQSSLRDDINTFDLVLVDGNGVRWVAPLFGFRVPERLDTDSLAPQLLSELAARRGRLFLFGCAPGVADAAGSRVTEAFPGLEVVGTEHGFHDVLRGHPGSFDDDDTRRIIAEINESAADVLLVSLPTPLQQRWVAEFAGKLDVPVIVTAGSYLDHIAENTSFPHTWYPAWADLLRLNWFYRLIKEPKRLWRRYTIEIADFIRLAAVARLRSLRTRAE
jgi:N-acetylglucosaminyldiphosphoundecaprenol N-acetyl-beta-D-mannosaminyltransferase